MEWSIDSHSVITSHLSQFFAPLQLSLSPLSSLRLLNSLARSLLDPRSRLFNLPLALILSLALNRNDLLKPYYFSLFATWTLSPHTLPLP
jgi:hypothetical protein